MHYDPQRHQSWSIQLKGQDYTSLGTHSVTVGVKNRDRALGNVIDWEMELSVWG